MRNSTVFSINRLTRFTPVKKTAGIRVTAYLQIRSNSTSTASSKAGAKASSNTDTINVQQIPAPGSGYVRVLLLNRPKARNAISKELLNALRFQVDAISAEQGNGPTRALVLASNSDSAFCAGADLKERKEMSKEECVFTPFYFLVMKIFLLSFRGLWLLRWLNSGLTSRL